MIAQLHFISHSDFSDVRWIVLRSTFGNKRRFVCASKGAVNLADQLHVVEEGVEGIEVGEAHHVGGGASCSLEKDP